MFLTTNKRDNIDTNIKYYIIFDYYTILKYFYFLQIYKVNLFNQVYIFLIN